MKGLRTFHRASRRWTTRFLIGLLTVIPFGSTTAADTQQVPSKPEQPKSVSLTDDHTIESYVGELKKQWQNANIVIDGGINQIKIPKGDLPKVSLPVALDWIQGTQEAVRQRVVLRRYGNREGTDQVFLLTTVVDRAQPVDDPKKWVRSLQDFDTTRSKDIACAVEKELSGTGTCKTVEQSNKPTDTESTKPQDAKSCPASMEKPAVTYYADLQLLIVCGRQKDLRLAEDVVQQVARGQRSESLTSLQKAIDTLKADQQKLKEEVARLKGDSKKEADKTDKLSAPR